MDLGLSKQHNTNSTMTSSTDQLGTLLYMSPEQLEGDVKAVSYPSDIWSIGVVWHEMLTNYTPFEPNFATKELGGSQLLSKRRTFSKQQEANIMNAVLEEGNRKLPMLDNLSDVLSLITAIIAKCLNADRHERYPDAQAFFNNLKEVLADLEKEAEPQSQSKASTRKPFKDWGTDEVFELVRSIGDAFTETAGELKDNGIDGKYFLAMLKNEDKDLTTSILLMEALASERFN